MDFYCPEPPHLPIRCPFTLNEVSASSSVDIVKPSYCHTLFFRSIQPTCIFSAPALINSSGCCCPLKRFGVSPRMRCFGKSGVSIRRVRGSPRLRTYLKASHPLERHTKHVKQPMATSDTEGDKPSRYEYVRIRAKAVTADSECSPALQPSGRRSHRRHQAATS